MVICVCIVFIMCGDELLIVVIVMFEFRLMSWLLFMFFMMLLLVWVMNIGRVILILLDIVVVWW